MAYKQLLIDSQWFTDQGVILEGGLVYIYAAGTTTPVVTYPNSSGTGGSENDNPIVLSSSGRLPNEIWIAEGSLYKVVVKTSADAAIPYAVFDNLALLNDVSFNQSVAEWVATGLTVSYVNSTTFTATGNQTALFAKATRLKWVCSAGTLYGTVKTVSFSGNTTVVVDPDAGGLDAGLSAMSVALITATNPSVDAGAVKYFSDISYTSGTVGAELNTLISENAGQDLVNTTTGTGSAFVLTPDPASASYTANQVWMVKFHTAGAEPATLNVSGLGAKTLKQYDSTGAKIAAQITASMISRVAYDGTHMIVLDQLPLSTSSPNMYSFSTSDCSADSQDYYLSAGDWTLSLTLSAGAEDTYGNYDFTIEQVASIVTVGSITASVREIRSGGSGFGRIYGRTQTKSAIFTINTAGTYTVSMNAATVTGSTTSCVKDGSLLILSKRA